jgi:hypothetical protein
MYVRLDDSEFCLKSILPLFYFQSESVLFPPFVNVAALDFLVSIIFSFFVFDSMLRLPQCDQMSLSKDCPKCCPTRFGPK